MKTIIKDKFIYMTEKLIDHQERLILKALDLRHYAHLIQLEAYKSGLEQALENYKIARKEETNGKDQIVHK